MGLFSSLGSVAKSVFTAVTPTQAKLQNVFDVLKIAVNPFSKDKIVANVSSPTLKTAIETVANHPYATAGLATGAITVIRAPAAAVTAAKTLIPATPAGKIAAVAATPVIAGAVISQPIQAAKAIISAPSELATFGKDVASFAVNPSIAGAKEVILNSPIISAGLAAAGVVAVGKAASTAATVYQASATKELSEKIAESALPTANSPLPTTPAVSNASSAVGKAASATPLTPATQEVKAVSTVKHRRRSALKSPKNNIISQRVSVSIGNRKINIGGSRRLAHGY